MCLALFDHLLGVAPGCFDYLDLLLDQHLSADATGWSSSFLPRLGARLARCHQSPEELLLATA